MRLVWVRLVVRVDRGLVPLGLPVVVAVPGFPGVLVLVLADR